MSRSNAYTPYPTRDGPLAADNEASALDVGTVVISTGGSAESVTIPAGTRLMRLLSDADFWYDFNTTAVIPTADDTSGSPIFLPAGIPRYVHFDGSNDTLSVIANATGALVNIVFWNG